MGWLLKNATTLVSLWDSQVLTAQGLVDVNAVIHLVMIYLSHLLLNQLDYLPQLKIDFEFQRNF